MPPVPWTVKVRDHPGSSAKAIRNEPDWDSGHTHRIGFKNKQDRTPGITHHYDDYDEEVEEARDEFREMKQEEEQGKLVNFRDAMEHQKNFHIKRPENRSLGWRYVLEVTEDFIKNKEDWPANVKKRQKEEEYQKKKEKENQGGEDDREQHGNEPQERSGQQEHEWKKSKGGASKKHHAAYTARVEERSGYDSGIDYDSGVDAFDDDGPNGQQQQQSEQQQLQAKYTPQEITLLRALRHERDYIASLRVNDGKGTSPRKGANRTNVAIDEADQFSPDNWLPRSAELIRLTGKHPLNAEAPLSALFDAGLVTPNELHYVRNHGAVPRLLWELHRLEIAGPGAGGDRKTTTVELSMEDLKRNFEAVNIPVTLACDGNRRKELNMLKRSKGFNWGAGAVSCAYWKGPLLRDVLVAAGIPEAVPAARDGKRWWVHFEGADEPSEGKYATCIPFDHVMDPNNDVLLAYEMNDVPLPPDHGYPVRLVVPGFVGGRCVKWLEKIWVSDKENDSHYHIWDNRVLPSFIEEKDGEFAEALFRHPDTACYEQNLNSVVVKPAHGEMLPLSQARKGRSYKISGYAYDGGGHVVQRVEVSLDGGKSWLYCIREFPDAPIRHGNKFWTWVHWHVEVELSHLLRADSITVRCFNVFKNTQPEEPSWNVMGMMNNSWYVVRPEIVDSEDSDVPCILFRHPVEPGTGDGGWMKPSTEIQVENAKQEAGAPQKQFTREEIEKHDKEDDCWIVVDGKVYDATSVLSWHPGGKAAVLNHAGKVHQETTNEFASIHDGYAYQKLKECILGVVTEKAANYIKKSAEAAAKDTYQDSKDDKVALQKHRWVPIRLIERKEVSEDTRTYTFSLPEGKFKLGLGTCQHIQLGFHMQDRMLIRSYTPTRPLLPASKGPLSTPSSSASSRRASCIPGPIFPPTAASSLAFRHPSRASISVGSGSGSGSSQQTSPTSPTFPRHLSRASRASVCFGSPFGSPQTSPTSPTFPGRHGSVFGGGGGSNGGDGGPARPDSMQPAMQRDGDGTFDVTVKTYFPDASQPGGALSNILDTLPIGAQVELRGPTGDITYSGCGNFTIEGRRRTFKRVSLVLGGSGVTPGYALLARVLLAADPTELRVVDANKAEGDILMKDELEAFERDGAGQLKVCHILSHPGEGWKGLKGHVDADVLKKNLFPPAKDNVVFLCGPPGMIQKAALPALRDWGYVEDENMFGF